jgi:hypothetical protein
LYEGARKRCTVAHVSERVERKEGVLLE